MTREGPLTRDDKCTRTVYVSQENAPLPAIEVIVNQATQDEVDYHGHIVGSTEDDSNGEVADLIPVAWIPGVGLVDRS